MIEKLHWLWIYFQIKRKKERKNGATNFTTLIFHHGGSYYIETSPY